MRYIHPTSSSDRFRRPGSRFRIAFLAGPLLIGCLDSYPVRPGTGTQTEIEAVLAGSSGTSPEAMALSPLQPREGFDPPGSWLEEKSDTAISMVFVPAHEGSGTPSDTGITRAVDAKYSGSLISLSDPGLPVSGTGSPGGGPNPEAGLITAGEWFDHSHWADFQAYLRKYPEHFQTWGLDLQRRIRLRVLDEDGQAVPDASVDLLQGGEPVFSGRTVADGTLAWFPGIGRAVGGLSAKVRYMGRGFKVGLSAVGEDDQVWEVRLPMRGKTRQDPVLDLAFVVDVTGSMGDELRFLQQELLDITAKAFQGFDARLRVGLVFYRDRGDDFVTKVHPFTSDVGRVTHWLKGMQASGGGDTPESVNRALFDAFRLLDWSESGAVKLCFLIADAPPHYYQGEAYTYAHGAAEAAARGIKIMPVAASGIDRATEYLFRMLAVRTQGKYIFITDDSGIGLGHLPAEVGDHKVESLNGILVRTLREEMGRWPGP